MKLKKYDDKLVRITTIDDEVFEGICSYNDKEYNEFEFGKKEESLQMIYFMFYKGAIKNVEILDDWSKKYDYFEEEIVKDGAYAIEEVFDSEESKHILRLLEYIYDHIDLVLGYKDELIKLLNILVKYNDDKEVVEKAKSVISKIK